MNFIFAFLLLLLSPKDNTARISKCYRTFAGTEIYSLSFSERKPLGTTVTTEIKLSNGKRVSVYLEDTYEAKFIDNIGELAIEYYVEKAQTSRYKDYVLSRFKKMIDHHSKDHGSDIQLDSFQIERHEFIGFTADDYTRSLLGNYNYFPDNKTIINIRFLNTTSLNIKSIEDYKRIRDTFLYSYVKYLDECNTK